VWCDGSNAETETQKQERLGRNARAATLQKEADIRKLERARAVRNARAGVRRRNARPIAPIDAIDVARGCPDSLPDDI
jgi:hypothetical protein